MHSDNKTKAVFIRKYCINYSFICYGHSDCGGIMDVSFFLSFVASAIISLLYFDVLFCHPFTQTGYICKSLIPSAHQVLHLSLMLITSNTHFFFCPLALWFYVLSRCSLDLSMVFFALFYRTIFMSQNPLHLWGMFFTFTAI